MAIRVLEDEQPKSKIRVLDYGANDDQSFLNRHPIPFVTPLANAVGSFVTGKSEEAMKKPYKSIKEPLADAAALAPFFINPGGGILKQVAGNALINAASTGASELLKGNDLKGSAKKAAVSGGVAGGISGALNSVIPGAKFLYGKAKAPLSDAVSTVMSEATSITKKDYKPAADAAFSGKSIFTKNKEQDKVALNELYQKMKGGLRYIKNKAGQEVGAEKEALAKMGEIPVFDVQDFIEKSNAIKNRGRGSGGTSPFSSTELKAIERAQLEALGIDEELAKNLNPVERDLLFSGKTKEKKIQNDPEFKKWFSDSQVIDDKRKPRVVYHGTSSDFKNFDPKYRGSNFGDEASKSGFFFTSDKNDAKYFANKSSAKTSEKPNVNPFYLSIKNPKVINEDTISDYNEKFLKGLQESDPAEYEFQISTKQYENSRNINKGLELAIVDAKSRGYDGAIVKDATDGVDWYIPFNESQIKSAKSRAPGIPIDDANIVKSKINSGVYSKSGVEPIINPQGPGEAALKEIAHLIKAQVKTKAPNLNVVNEQYGDIRKLVGDISRKTSDFRTGPNSFKGAIKSDDNLGDLLSQSDEILPENMRFMEDMQSLISREQFRPLYPGQGGGSGGSEGGKNIARTSAVSNLGRIGAASGAAFVSPMLSGALTAAFSPAANKLALKGIGATVRGASKASSAIQNSPILPAIGGKVNASDPESFPNGATDPQWLQTIKRQRGIK